MDWLRKAFRRVRRFVIRLWRINFAVVQLLRFNPYTGFIGRRIIQYIPFLMPHDKSYYGFTHLVHDGDGLFLDVGANDGISAVGFHHIHSDYRILSIEPNLCHERALRKLKRSIKGFDYKLLGAGSKRCQMTLYIPMYNGVPAFSVASLHKNFVVRAFDDRPMPQDQIKSVVILEHKVDIIPLDDLQVRPDIIKIDTEGFELEVILGLVKTIEACRPHILIEYNYDLMEQEKMQAFFKERDYRLLTYDPKKDKFHEFQKKQGLESYADQLMFTNIFCIAREKSLGLL